MVYTAQHMTDGLADPILDDLRNLPLEEVAIQVRDGRDRIQDIVAHIVDGAGGQPPVSATTFNSAT
jgi:hypothetical protein